MAAEGPGLAQFIAADDDDDDDENDELEDGEGDEEFDNDEEDEEEEEDDGEMQSELIQEELELDDEEAAEYAAVSRGAPHAVAVEDSGRGAGGARARAQQKAPGNRRSVTFESDAGGAASVRRLPVPAASTSSLRGSGAKGPSRPRMTVEYEVEDESTARSMKASKGRAK